MVTSVSMQEILLNFIHVFINTVFYVYKSCHVMIGFVTLGPLRHA